MTVAYRLAEPEDRVFIVDAWVSSYRTAHAAGMIAMEDWREIMWRQVEKVLDRPTTDTVVAYEPEETDHLADLQGFITADISAAAPYVFYVYVKESFRRAGYARGLFRALGIDPAAPFTYACKTAAVADLVRMRKIPCSKWDPLAARFANKMEQPRRRR